MNSEPNSQSELFENIMEGGMLSYACVFWFGTIVAIGSFTVISKTLRIPATQLA
jgi:hypothetical protein